MGTPYVEDGTLLARFAEKGDQPSFEELMRRHGGLVFGVCCRTLGQTQDAEDATQAVFLTLASKAQSLKRFKSVAGWLHQVAHHIALRAKAAAQSRRKREREVGMAGITTPQSVEPDREWESIMPHLDAELAALPEKYRIPIILHHVEGRTQEEIAELLGCSYGTLSGRLSRAREMLRSRLARRGAAVALAMLFLSITKNASAAMPAELMASTGRAAPYMLAGHAAAPGLFSAQAKALSEGALQAMFISKVRTAAAIAAVILFSVSAAAYASRAPISPPLQTVAQTGKAAGKPDAVKDDKTPPVAPAAEVDPQIAVWILQLGSENADIRLAAMDGLRKAGDAAVGALASAAAKAAGETKSRAEILIGVRKTSKIVQTIVAQEKLIKSIEADLEGSALMGGMNVSITGHLKALPQSNQTIEDHVTKLGPMEMPGRVVSDGKILWTESQLPALGTEKRVMVTKSSADDKAGWHKQEWQFGKYSDEFDFVKAREENVNGVDAYILEGVAREDFLKKLKQEFEEAGIPAIPGPLYTSMQTCTIMVGKDGFIRRFEIRDDKNVVTQMVAYTNVKIDSPLDVAQFTYCPPINTKVTDLDEFEKTSKTKNPEPAAVKPPEAPKNF